MLSDPEAEDKGKKTGFNVGVAMAVGGSVAAVAGAVTLKPGIEVAGVAVAGTGCAIASANKRK